MKRVLVARQDNNGDVVLTGPAIRAVAASGARVTMLCGPRGAAAARLLPGIADVIVEHAAWIDAEPEAVDAATVEAFLRRISTERFDEAVIFTSFHQSPLPLALLLRMANVPRIGAVSVDYPGSLLDVRHRIEDDVHEVERNLSLVAAMGYTLGDGDDRRLRLNEGADAPRIPFGPYVVVHPGATVAARRWSVEGNRALVELLARRGRRVVVTGAASEAALAAAVVPSDPHVLDMCGRTSFAEFVAILRAASVVVCGNTVAAHVASAVGTPVVSIFPPTIPAARFRPWLVAHELLGDQTIACAGCRSRVCPFAGQPCLAPVTPESVATAVERLILETDIAGAKADELQFAG